MTSRKPAFEVDKKGLGALLERRGREFAVLELVQNALDEPSVTKVSVVLEPSATRGYHNLLVEDDAPEGFYDISHAFTLFKDNRKRANAEKRGRFNLGEKLVIAICKEASIVTTTGGVAWDDSGRRSLRTRTDEGSRFEGLIRMNLDEGERALAAAHRVILPEGVAMAVNGQPVARRLALKTIEVTLPTEFADDEGMMRPTRRKTSVSMYTCRGDEPQLYELGIPVVESGLPWHVDIGQRVPMPMDRDNVSPAYARKLRAAVLNAMHEELPPEAASEGWVKDALASGELSDEAVDTTITKLYGDKRVIRDPSDPEATKRAMSEGYAVMEPRSFNRNQWTSIKAAGAARPAGQVMPTHHPEFGADGEDTRVPEAKYTKGMRAVVEWTRRVSAHLIGHTVNVEVVRDKTNLNSRAWYGRGGLLGSSLTFNLQRLGHMFFNAGVTDDVVELVIHELGHEYSSDHLSREYYDGLCELGTRLGRLAIEEPELLKGWVTK
jgi:hypothetical protein